MPNGTARDYVYVDDVCKAIQLCITNGDNEIFNIGTCLETYTRDIFDSIKEITKSKSDLILKSARTGDVRRGILDVSKAKNMLGWDAKINLSDGLRLTYQSFIMLIQECK